MAVLAPAIALMWIGVHFFEHDHRVYSSGRLSQAHAVLEKECAECHVQQTGGFSAAAADSACLACHDGPPHHATNVNVKLACAECHAEHRGRAGLAAVSDRTCARCHANLQAATGFGGSVYAKHIVSFPGGHPEFAELGSFAGHAARDAGSIKLNHALHMQAIRRGPNGPNVQLECGDCHRAAASENLPWNYSDPRYAAVHPPDSTHALRIAVPTFTGVATSTWTMRAGLRSRHPASNRELMAPPKFANACAGCHLLTFDKRFDEGVPHDKPEVVHAYLVKKFTEYIATHAAELHEMLDPQRSFTLGANGPGVRLLSPAQWVAERVAVSEELLWHKTCSQCHAISVTPLRDTKIAWWDAASSNSLSRIASSNVTERLADALPNIFPANVAEKWLPNARFDHDAHRGFSCT
ncbi:MAG TPA: hypothetical protein VM781_01405, partial [Candidatus Bathyarchaeia archaeon]|nr:hypothetical protein [Candidatus Bathyarchaeia archaeon]